MIKKGIHSVFLFFGCFLLHSQTKPDSVLLQFKPELANQPLELNKAYISGRNEELSITAFRCYIANIKLEFEDQSSFTENESYHLLDSDNQQSFCIPLEISKDKKISKITFNIGIDSLTNTLGAMEGDLDPVKGMYWAWQSGYINMKIEGKSPICSTRNNEFQFHIGGYLPPFNAIRNVTLYPTAKQNAVYIGINLDRFFKNISLSETNSIMIPGKQAMQLADEAVQMFYIK